MAKPTVRTEDGVEVAEGDTVFDYYSMAVGVVGKIEGERTDEFHSSEMQGSTNPWFDVIHEDGKHQLLNGQRICSVDAAKRKGWLR